MCLEPRAFLIKALKQIEVFVFVLHIVHSVIDKLSRTIIKRLALSTLFRSGVGWVCKLRFGLMLNILLPANLSIFRVSAQFVSREGLFLVPYLREAGFQTFLKSTMPCLSAC